jgi:hypothetical protein
MSLFGSLFGDDGDRGPFDQPPADPSGLADPWYQLGPEAPWLAHAHVRLPLARMQAARDPSPRNLLELYLAERDADPWDR